IPRLITSTPAARLAATLRSSSANRYGGISARRSLGLIELLLEVVTELAAVHGPGPAGQVDVEVRAEEDVEPAAVEFDADSRRPAVEVVGDGGAGGARPRGERLPHPALEDPRADQAGLELGVPGDVGPPGKALVVLDRRADRREVERVEGIRANRTLGVADRDVAKGP